jgi:hypothetical protein
VPTTTTTTTLSYRARHDAYRTIDKTKSRTQLACQRQPPPPACHQLPARVGIFFFFVFFFSACPRAWITITITVLYTSTAPAGARVSCSNLSESEPKPEPEPEPSDRDFRAARRESKQLIRAASIHPTVAELVLSCWRLWLARVLSLYPTMKPTASDNHRQQTSTVRLHGVSATSLELQQPMARHLCARTLRTTANLTPGVAAVVSAGRGKIW